MLKRVLHAANQVVTHPETHSSTRSLQIQNTVNDKVDMLKLGGDSWQLKQKQGKNLLDLDRAEFLNCEYDKVTKTIKSNLNNYYYCYIDVNYLIPYIFNKQGKSITFSYASENKKSRCSIVIYGRRTGSDIVSAYENTSNSSISKVTLTIPKDYEYISKIELRFNRRSTPFTDTETVYSNFMLEESDDATDYEPFRAEMPTPYYPSEIKSVSGEVKSCGWNLLNDAAKPYDCYRGSEITIPELRAIRDEDGNIVARDCLHVDRKAKRAWVERAIHELTFNGLERIDVYKDGLYYQPTKYHIVKYALCSHFTNSETPYPVKGKFSSYINKFAFHFFIDDSPEEFKTFLTDQYNNGNAVKIVYGLESPFIEELPYSDYLLSTAQYQTNIRFIDLDEHLQPQIEATVKVLGR